MRRFLLTAIFCFFVISSAFSDQTYSVIEAIQRKFQQQTAFAFLDIRLPAPNILQLSFRGKLFDPAQYGPEFRPDNLNKDGTVWGPGEQGFVLTFRQLSKEPEGMKFQPDGIALEQNKENGVWEETFYAIKLTDGYVLVSIAYDKDVNWDTVADVEDEVLFAIDHLRVNYFE